MRTRLGVWLALGALLISSTRRRNSPPRSQGKSLTLPAPRSRAPPSRSPETACRRRAPRRPTRMGGTAWICSRPAPTRSRSKKQASGASQARSSRRTAATRPATSSSARTSPRRSPSHRRHPTSTSPRPKSRYSYKREFIDSLPLERSYKGLLQLTPGVAENGTFAPNGGGSRQDNTYLIDGASITNPLFGYLSTEVNELDVAEVHIKRGAVSAESGRSQGFITNVVTKSGTNRLMGTYRFEAIPAAWIQESDRQVRASTTAGSTPRAPAGRSSEISCFSTGSGRLFSSTAAGAANFFGPLPDAKDKSHELSPRSLRCRYRPRC